MEVTRDSKCLTCKHAKGGTDPRFDGYRIFCDNPKVVKGDNDKPPACYWDNRYALYEKGERKVPSGERTIFDISSLYYNGLKGRILSIVESQVDSGSRLDATKQVVENVLSQTEKELQDYLRSVFIDWGIK